MCCFVRYWVVVEFVVSLLLCVTQTSECCFHFHQMKTRMQDVSFYRRTYTFAVKAPHIGLVLFQVLTLVSQNILILCAAASSTRQPEVLIYQYCFARLLFWHFVANSFQIDCLKSRFTERVIHLHLYDQSNSFSHTIWHLCASFTAAIVFVTAIFHIPILWLHLLQINSPLLLWRVNKVTPQKWRCVCQYAYVEQCLTFSVTSWFDCLYPVTFSGRLGFCLNCF